MVEPGFIHFGVRTDCKRGAHELWDGFKGN